MAFGQAVKKILERVGDFFDIFDLSFFVSGALLFAALAFSVMLIEAEHDASPPTELMVEIDAANKLVAEAEKQLADTTLQWLAASGKRAVELNLDREQKFARLTERRVALLVKQKQLATFSTKEPAVVRFANKTSAPLAILGIYILGLLCFAVGRLRGRWRWIWPDLKTELSRAIEHHSLQKDPLIASYYQPAGGGAATLRADELYTRLWAWLRGSNRTESYKLLRRYWVMTAVYEGVAVALFVWVPLGYFGLYQQWQLAGVVTAAALLVLVVMCKREAAKYYRYQIREVIATYAQAASESSSPAPVDPVDE